MPHPNFKKEIASNKSYDSYHQLEEFINTAENPYEAEILANCLEKPKGVIFVLQSNYDENIVAKSTIIFGGEPQDMSLLIDKVNKKYLKFYKQDYKDIKFYRGVVIIKSGNNSFRTWGEILAPENFGRPISPYEWINMDEPPEFMNSKRGYLMFIRSPKDEDIIPQPKDEESVKTMFLVPDNYKYILEYFDMCNIKFLKNDVNSLKNIYDDTYSHLLNINSKDDFFDEASDSINKIKKLFTSIDIWDNTNYINKNGKIIHSKYNLEILTNKLSLNIKTESFKSKIKKSLIKIFK